jgi:hypothetical protein
MSPTSQPTALIFGASGIIGWGVTRALLSYPSPKTFAHIIALTNRPLSQGESYLPIDSILSLIPHITEVTHIYFASYTGHSLPYLERKALNVSILSAAIRATTSLSPSVQSIIFFGGGKAYGLEFAAELPREIAPKTPFREDTPRLPQPWGDNVFYYAQYDELLRLREESGAKWRFAEVRPDAVIGFVPKGNPMNIAQNLGLWLSLVKDIQGDGAEVVFPGSWKAYTAKHSDSSQMLVGRFVVQVSLQTEGTDGQIFNIADGMSTWEEDWPRICALFKLNGVGPKEGVVTGKEWVMRYKDQWAGWVSKYNLKEGVLEGNDWEFIGFLMEVESDRQMELQKARDLGFAGEMDGSDVVAGYASAFELMRAAKMIP